MPSLWGAHRYGRKSHRFQTRGDGGNKALYVSIQSLISPGDEVILLEPYFELYVGQIKLAGGIPKFVPLKNVDNYWELDEELLRR